jgi:hypothetical protein
MSKSEQPIASIDPPDGYNIWLMEPAHTWTGVEIVQQLAGQLPSIEDIERELRGFDGGDV